MTVERRLVWKFLATGEFVDGAVPFLPPSRAVWAIPTEKGWKELSDTPGDDRQAHA